MPWRNGGDVAEIGSAVEHRAIGKLGDRTAVDALPWRRIRQNGGNAVALAALNFRLVHQHVATALIEIDADDVTGPEPGKAAAGGTPQLMVSVQARSAANRKNCPFAALGSQMLP